MPNGSRAFLPCAVFALFFAAPTLAKAQHYSTDYDHCHARAHSVVQESVCAQAELGKQDDRLNKAYQQLMAQDAKEPARQATLRTEERAWIKKRDYDCKINGTTIDDDCLMRQTAQRADLLESQVKF